MIGATQQIEITVHTINQPAIMGRLIAITVSCGSEVLAATSYWDGSETVVKLVTEKPVRTLHALQAAGFDCRSNPIVLVEVPDKSGVAEFLNDKLLGAGLTILHTYSFRSDRGLDYVVFKTTDDHRAVYILEVEALIHGLASVRNWRQAAGKILSESGPVKQAA